MSGRDEREEDDGAGAGLRKIIHVDMDAFFASVEQRDDPSLRGKPVAVGGSSGRGVVAAASYEARVFGVRSAMPSGRALRLCPELIFCKARFEVYREVSQQIRAIFRDYTEAVEPLSLDEAYLDVTHDLKGIGLATRIAEDIRRRIREDTGLTASAGVSYNKFLAKLASDHRKPNGLFVITPRMGPAFVESLPIGKFHGVGPATSRKMAELGIATGGDLRQHARADLTAWFGKAGDYYYNAARAEDHRPVMSDRQRKSVGAETTFQRDLTVWEEVVPALTPVFAKVWAAYSSTGLMGHTVTVKIKYADFRQITRARSRVNAIASHAEIEQMGLDLLRPFFPTSLGVRLLGVSLSHLDAEAGPTRQLTLAIA